LLSSDGRYVSVLHCRKRDVIGKFVVYLRINFHLSNLTRSPTMQHEVFSSSSGITVRGET
jgi:hypothetical protein